MTQSKSKFPFWIIIIIAALIIVAFIIGNFFAVKHIVADVGKPTQVGPFSEIPARIPLKIEHVIAIATIITPTAIVIANILLVTITLYYARQTAKMADKTAEMAEGTKKMVDQHNKEWRIDLRPLFVPLDDKLDDNDNMTFKFINLGNLALFFNIKNVEQNREIKLHTVSTGEDVSITITNVTKTIVKGVMNRKNRTDPTILTFIITFQDKVANKYTQTINYHFTEKKWQFIFEDSCFPKPTKKEKV